MNQLNQATWALKFDQRNDVNISSMDFTEAEKERHNVKNYTNSIKQKFNNHKLKFQACSFCEQGNHWVTSFGCNPPMGETEATILIDKFSQIAGIGYRLARTAIGVYKLGACDSKNEIYFQIYINQIKARYYSLVYNCSSSATQLNATNPTNNLEDKANRISQINNIDKKITKTLNPKFKNKKRLLTTIEDSYVTGVDFELDCNLLAPNMKTGKCELWKLPSHLDFNRKYLTRRTFNDYIGSEYKEFKHPPIEIPVAVEEPPQSAYVG